MWGGRARPTEHPKSEIVYGPTDALDYPMSEITIGSKVGIDATKKLPGEGFSELLVGGSDPPFRLGGSSSIV